MEFVVGGLAAVSAGFFTNPLEVLKIRLQLQGELRARGHHTIHYKNVLHAAVVVAKTDGVLALQKGLVPALWTQLFLNGARLGTYQIATSRGFISGQNGKEVVLWRSVVAGFVGGVFGAVACSPMFLIKTQLQSQAAASIAVGHQHHHAGTWSALKTICAQQGIKGLFRGVEAAMPRGGIGSAAQLTSFTLTKDYLLKHSRLKDSETVVTIISSMVGGVAVSVAMNPFDLVTTRLYNQGVDAKGRGMLYSGAIDCVHKILTTEGVLAFYKGLGPNFLRLGPHSVLCLTFWDYYKKVYDRIFEKDVILGT